MLAPADRQQLIALIEHHTPFHKQEAQYQAAILQLLHTCANPLDRENYDPGHITGSAWIVAEKTNQIGLIYHHRLAWWLQPGGHVEAGETDILRVALREVQEEMGIAPDPLNTSLFDVDVHPIPETSVHPPHLHFDIRFLCRVEAQAIAPASDAEQARWFSVHELRQLHIDESMHRMLNKCLQRGILRDD
jgi:8-oxo-dGTP pyrophosphatase MutT (NUDIX family)